MLGFRCTCPRPKRLAFAGILAAVRCWRSGCTRRSSCRCWSLIFVYAGREEAQRAEEVDVAFRDASNEELPADLPPVDDTPPPPRAMPAETPEQPRASAERKTRRRPRTKTKPTKLAEKRPSRPSPSQSPRYRCRRMPPMPKPEQPPIPKPEERAHEKMVDLDNDKEVEPPPDAKFLAQKNNRAVEETRATDTNLREGAAGGGAGLVGAVGAAGPGGRRRQGEDRRARGREVGAGPQGARGHAARQPRADPARADAARAQVAAGAARCPAPRARADARDRRSVAAAHPRRPRSPCRPTAARAGRAPRPSAWRKGKRMKLALTAKDYEYLFGADAAAERRLAQTERSKKVGRFQQRLGRVQSALENFIPEVKPGNQTALNTRAAPFAAFIARMHRSIHKLWGFGVLEEWDEKSGSNPFNNPNLLTTLEMRAERRRHRRQGHGRSRPRATCPTTPPRSTSSTAPAPIPIRRARSARRTARSTSTGASIATRASARPRASTTSSSTTRPRTATP